MDKVYIIFIDFILLSQAVLFVVTFCFLLVTNNKGVTILTLTLLVFYKSIKNLIG